MSTLQNPKADNALFLMASLDKLRHRGRHCDFTIKVENQSFSAHRVVLSACSDYFSAMLSCDMKEAREGVVYVKDEEADAVKHCIDFMYTGEATITVENVQSVLKASHLMQLPRLTKLCFTFLGNELKVDNCLTVKNLADIYGDDVLIERAMSYAIENFEGIIKYDLTGFLCISFSDLRLVLKGISPRSDLHTRWDAIKTWIQHDEKKRIGYLNELMDLSRIYEGSFEFLFRHVLNENLVKRSTFCRKAVIFEMFQDIDTLSKNINFENCFNLYEAAKSSESFINTRAREEIKQFLKNVHISVIFDNHKLAAKNLSKEEVSLLFEKSDRSTASEHCKWNFAVEWTRHRRERKKLFPKLIQMIEYEKFTERFFRETVLPEPLVRHSRKCKNLLETYYNDHYASGPVSILILDRGKAKINSVNPVSREWNLHSSFLSSQISFITDLNAVLYLFRDGALFQYTKNGQWNYRSTYPSDPRDVLALVAHQESIYFMSHRRETILCFNSFDNSMAEVRFQLKGGFGSSFVATKDFIYTIGGSKLPRSTHRFDPSKESCKKLASTNHYRQNSAAAVLKGKIFVLGGCFATQSVEVYDPVANIWSEVANLQHHRQLFSAVVADGKLYAVGGVYSHLNSDEDLIEEYNYEENYWTVLTTIQKTRGNTCACTYRKLMDEPVKV